MESIFEKISGGLSGVLVSPTYLRRTHRLFKYSLLSPEEITSTPSNPKCSLMSKKKKRGHKQNWISPTATLLDVCLDPEIQETLSYPRLPARVYGL